MIVLLDTSTPVAKMTLFKDDQKLALEWEAGRELAKGIFTWIEQSLKDNEAVMQDIQGIGVFKGPGSFTGLRIGMTVANTLADSLSAPIVAAEGDDWQDECIRRLQNDENDKITLPLYDREANITKPRK